MNQEKYVAKVNRGMAGEGKEEERRDGIHSPRVENQFNTGGGPSEDTLLPQVLEGHQSHSGRRFLCMKKERFDLEQRAGTVAQQEKT